MATFRILSLDGGGIRGAFSAAFLAEIERKLDIQLADHFDLIAGTSTGGIIGIGLALGEPADRIVSFYQAKGPRVFERRRSPNTGLMRRALQWTVEGAAVGRGGISGLLVKLAAPFCGWVVDRCVARFGVDLNALLRTRYEPVELERALKEVFGSRTLESTKTRIIVPSVDLVSGQPVVFKSPHLPDACSRDGDYTAVEVAMATAAAPTYFPHVCLRSGSAYCDGGLWANNPVLVAIAEAQRLFRTVRSSGQADDRTIDDIQVLSVGTGKGRFSVVPPDAAAGLAWWGPRILDVMSLSQAAGTNHAAGFVLGPERLYRVDFDLPDESWKLDSIEHLDKLVHLGRQTAHSHLSRLREVFFSERRSAREGKLLSASTE